VTLEIWRNIFDAIDVPAFFHDTQFRVMLANLAYCREAGVTESEALGLPYWKVFPPGIGPFPGWKDEMEIKGSGGNQEEVIVGEKVFLSRNYTARDYQGKSLYFLHILSDISLQKQIEVALTASEEHLRRITETARDAIITIDGESGLITAWNPASETIFGYSEEEVIGQRLHDFLPPPRMRETASKGMAHFATSGEGAVIGKTLELVALHKNGTEFPVEVSLTAMQIHDKWHATCIARDITERKLANERLLKSEARYKRIIEGLTDYQYTVLVENGHPVKTLQSLGCVTVTGYTPEDFAADPYLWIQLVAPEDRDKIRERVQQTLAGKEIPPFEYRIIRKDGVARWVSDTTILFKDASGNLQSYDGVIKDITALKTSEDQNQRYLARLENAFMRTVEVATTLIEMRDPYTAGHERRVAELAAAIGSELGWDARRVDGLRVAGQLHDIGKISIPAEILAKPGKITAAEYLLIKDHARAGYDALKGVEFPWPVAEVAWQHHERMDGSGYPRGLKGDEILLEARIMSVADVIEAMASHRPYRPGHGIDKALDEIELGSGSAYDTMVAEACLRLFREKEYSFPSWFCRIST
jgi:PAS domain S-box-containing protein